MEVFVDNRQDDLAIDTEQAKRVVESVLALHNCACDQVALHFVSTPEICDLHAQFFSDPSPTDCISLPMDREPTGGTWILGEIFVCPEAACRYSKSHEVDTYRETTLYIVHGLLHLLGYDDIDEADRVEMRREEKRCLAQVEADGAMLKLP